MPQRLDRVRVRGANGESLLAVHSANWLAGNLKIGYMERRGKDTKLAENGMEMARQGKQCMSSSRQSVIKLMTIGYEGLSLADFFGILGRCGVSMIVDVRELPISRRRGFAKSALTAALAAKGIKYVHMSALGCPRDVRHAYRDDGDWNYYTRRFKTYLETQLPALNELAELMRKERCCLLCFEEDYNFCHRSFVAERVARLAETPIRVDHLTGPIQGRVACHDLVAA